MTPGGCRSYREWAACWALIILMRGARFPAVMYDKAAALKAQGQEDEADDLFGQIIEAYPDTDYAVMSREQRGY